MRCQPTGSPPRMRGKDAKVIYMPDTIGITPAYAGKSYCRIGKLSTKKDHPRVCGEKIIVFVGCVELLGSPPRMRGKD